MNDAGLLYRLDLATLQVDPIVLDTAPAGSFFYRTIDLFLDMTWAKPYDPGSQQ